MSYLENEKILYFDQELSISPIFSNTSFSYTSDFGRYHPCCIVNEERGYQSSITSYNVVCGPPGPHSELLSPGLEESLLSVSETLYISHMPLLRIDMKTKVVQHVPRVDFISPV